MDTEPRFIPAAEIQALRAERARPARFAGLYVCGGLDALAAPTVAIVGSRAASEQGRRIAWNFAAALAKAGVCVLSGLALGIDGAAHAGALSVGAPTIGVLGGGHRRFFPRKNRELAAAMSAKGGAVVSPYAPDEAAMPGRFLQRNGVIAALSDAVVVIEAACRSGSLNTAAWAAASSIPVLAVPGDIDRPKVAGCHALIRDGATLARNAEDVLEAIGMTSDNSRTKPATQLSLPLDPLQLRLMETLTREPQNIEALLALHAVTLAELLGALAHLSLAGIVREDADGMFRTQI